VERQRCPRSAPRGLAVRSRDAPSRGRTPARQAIPPLSPGPAVAWALPPPGPRQPGRLAMEEIGSDLRLGVGALLPQPVLSAVLVLSLALGIGANTALFSVADALLLRPLPVAHPEQLALLSWSCSSGFPAQSLSGSLSFDAAGGSSS